MWRDGWDCPQSVASKYVYGVGRPFDALDAAGEFSLNRISSLNSLG